MTGGHRPLVARMKNTRCNAIRIGAGDTKAQCAGKCGMAVFTMIKCELLMYEASISGQKYNFRPLIGLPTTRRREPFSGSTGSGLMKKR